VTPPDGAFLVGNRWTTVEATVTPGASGMALRTVDLWWSYNDLRFPCPGRGGNFYCTVEGDRYRWVIHTGTGGRAFAVNAVDAAGATGVSSVTRVAFADGPTDCRESASGRSSIWTCTRDGQSRDRCVANRLERQRCDRGCLASPPGVDDVCNP